MLIIDAQVHAYERDRPERPWHAVLAGPPSVTGEEMIAAMDEAGVAGALLGSPFTMYRFDPSYAIEVRAAYPGRFALIKPVDPADPAVEDSIAAWRDTKGAVAIRLMLNRGISEDAADPGIARVMKAAARHGFPVNVLAWDRLAQADRMAALYPDTVMVIDHLGLNQPHYPPVPADAWDELPTVLGLARYPNVRIKVTGACTLSHEAYPYVDIWAKLARVFDAFTLDRCLWGTDWTRAVGLLTYRQGVDAFRDSAHLSDGERETLMGGTLTKVYGWAPAKP